MSFTYIIEYKELIIFLDCPCGHIFFVYVDIIAHISLLRPSMYAVYILLGLNRSTVYMRERRREVH